MRFVTQNVIENITPLNPMITNINETGRLSPISDTNAPPSGIAQRQITPMIEDNLPIISGAVVFMITAEIGAFTTGKKKPNKKVTQIT